jgi:hypothetical protein
MADLGFDNVRVQPLIVDITIYISMKVKYNLYLFVNINRSRLNSFNKKLVEYDNQLIDIDPNLTK